MGYFARLHVWEKKRRTRKSLRIYPRVGGRRSAIRDFYACHRISRGTRECIPEVSRRSPFAEKNSPTSPFQQQPQSRPSRPEKQIYRVQFSMLAAHSPSSISLTLARDRYEKTRARTFASSITDGRSAAWVISHARTGPTAPFEYLSVCRVAPTTVTTIEGARREKKCFENWSRSSPQLDKPFKRD